ncbi:MAG: SDR family oxidoreductase [Opitutales bacterium]|nr:SDR family oxidoreductase [Opitutales bacterium]
MARGIIYNEAMDFLKLEGKKILVAGVANKKSVAWFVAKTLEEAGATVIYSVRSEARAKEAFLTGKPVYVCDVENEDAAGMLAAAVQKDFGGIDGFVHSIAFANFSEGFKPFHETLRKDFLQATQISAFSFVELARALAPLMPPGSAAVSVGISSQVTAANYGYMSPIKAALESATRFLAKSFSNKGIRFNSVNAGPLKTSASAGIPGYLKNYLFAEALTMRKRNLSTQEVADAIVWLLSPRSSGVNAQSIVVDAGMGWNFFDESVVAAATALPKNLN